MKYLVSASAAVLMLSSVSADVVAQEEAPAVEEAQEEVVEHCNCDLLNGFYAGLGIGYSRTKNSNLVKVLTWATQGGNNGTRDLISNKANKFIGTVVLGGGKVFGQGFYFGGEAMADFSKNKKKYEKYNAAASAGNAIAEITTAAADQFITKTENKGFEWNVGVRAGYAVQNGTLVYAKLGVTQSKLKEAVYVAASATDNSVNADTNKLPYMEVNANAGLPDSKLPLSYTCNKVAPMIALGVEKVMSNGLSGRVEIEYDFKAKKNHADPIATTTSKIKLQRKNAFKARLLLSKHISM